MIYRYCVSGLCSFDGCACDILPHVLRFVIVFVLLHYFGLLSLDMVVCSLVFFFRLSFFFVCFRVSVVLCLCFLFFVT